MCYFITVVYQIYTVTCALISETLSKYITVYYGRSDKTETSKLIDGQFTSTKLHSFTTQPTSRLG